jgi:CRISPR-associated protein Cmr1
MKTIKATYRINTPMFIGGADTQGDSEIRMSSFKGALQFWWRALAYGRFDGDLQKIKKEEEEIFGSTERQAKILFSLSPEKLSTNKSGSIHPKLQKSSGLLYLGYGVCESFGHKKKGQLKRSCIEPMQDFTVQICSKEEIDSNIIRALQMLGLVGGLGSKSRKGYGSLTLMLLKKNEDEIYSVPSNPEELKKVIQSIMQEEKLSSRLPEYSAFSDYTRIDIVKEDSDALVLLNHVGETMQLYRSWGSNNKVNGKSAEKNFVDDHELALKFSENKTSSTHPKRIVFGLPHNYFFSSTNGKVDFEPFLDRDSSINRRSSPMLIHIHSYSDTKFAAIVTIMPAKFLPDQAKIKAKNNRLDCKEDFSVLHEFLDGKKGPREHKTKEPYFPSKMSILSPRKTMGEKNE